MTRDLQHESKDLYEMAKRFTRTGTLEEPIMVKSFGDEQYCGCTGYPVDSHSVLWLTVSPTIISCYCYVRSIFFMKKEVSRRSRAYNFPPCRSPANARLSAAQSVAAFIRSNTSVLQMIHTRITVSFPVSLLPFLLHHGTSSRLAQEKAKEADFESDGPEFPEPKTISDFVKPEYYWR